MASLLSNYFRYRLLKKVYDFSNDTFKIILMQPGYVFNRATHKNYSDVSASELATANGYTAGGLTLSGVTVTQDDTDNRGEVTWSNAQWNIITALIIASGAIIYDSTVANDVVGYIDFGGNKTTLPGAPCIIANPLVYV